MVLQNVGAFMSPYLKSQLRYCDKLAHPRIHEMYSQRTLRNYGNKAIMAIKDIHQNSSMRLPSLRMVLDPDYIDVEELSALLAATGQNCSQFPVVSPDGSIARADPFRLQRALRNSTVTVGMYANPDFHIKTVEYEKLLQLTWPKHWLVGQNTKECLVAFGRATSDGSLTACIHDLAVMPSMQRLGIGRRVLQQIVRSLTGRGIWDIAALSSPTHRSFFQACGFEDDVLGSTTMMYGCMQQPGEYGEFKVSGRRILVVP